MIHAWPRAAEPPDCPELPLDLPLVLRPRAAAGLTLIELMIVVALIALLASIAVPNMLSSRISTNEAAAIHTLRTLMSAQATASSAKVIDDDQDSVGEYGFLGELAGGVALNGRAGGNGSPNPMDPPVLGPMFRFVRNSRVQTSGYFFQVHLPDNLGTGTAEDPNGGPTGAENANLCENYWVAYAYPVSPGRSGNRAFCVNERGEVRQTRMDNLLYGPASVPVWNAAYNPIRGDFSDSFGSGPTAVDGNIWVTVQ